jgi:uncharacterized protein (DUF305 family)
VRPSRWQVVTLVVALCFLSGVVGWWIARPSDPTFNDVDVGFLSDMQAHHGGAISLAFAYLGREHDTLIGQMAREIVLEQSQEISVMNAYLGQAGPSTETTDDVAMDWMGLAVPITRMPGMPTDAEMAELRAAQGAEADEVFTRLMINHHAAGVAMADAAAEHGENDNVRRLATAMAKVQRSEIAELNHRRATLGFAPVDAKALEDLHAEHAG